MLFNAPLFLFLFFPATLACYFLAPRRLKNAALLSASILFYAWGEPRFVAVVLLSALADYLCGSALHKNADRPRRVRWLVGLGVAQNLGMLFYFKYANFFVDSFNEALRIFHIAPLRLAAIALPIGVSFIVFEKITYIVDIARRVGHPARTFGLYLLYVFFFPKLLAGPIIKYHDIEEQLESRTHTFENLKLGLWRFAVGLGKKTLIADPLGNVVNKAFGLPAGDLGFHTAWVGIVCFALQIYFDFSGYSDMAIGLGRILGFRLRENFNLPYVAASFTEFWRRWHISLSTWIREYVYIPMGGNRLGTGRTYFNLWFCFFLSGLWHGARWTFVLWGVYHGVFLVLDKLFWLDAQRRLPRWLNTAITFLLVLIGWVLFRAESVPQIGAYLAALVSGPGNAGRFIYLGNEITFLVAVGLLLAFTPALRRPGRAGPDGVGAPALAGALLLLLLCIVRISNATFNPFLYFRF